MDDFNAKLPNNSRWLLKNLYVLKPQIILHAFPHSTSLLLPYFKSYFKKIEPKKLTYRDYKNFSNQQFQAELVKGLRNNSVVDGSQFELFQTISLRLLSKLAPTKQKIIRNNQFLFELRKGEKKKTIFNDPFKVTQ